MEHFLNHRDIEQNEVRYWGAVPGTYSELQQLGLAYADYLRALPNWKFGVVALRVERILPLLHGGVRCADLLPGHLRSFAVSGGNAAGDRSMNFWREGWLQRISALAAEEFDRRLF
jgi:hypothetical protein